MTDTKRRIAYLAQLDRFCKTTHGANPLTEVATQNMFALMRHFDDAVALVSGVVSSGYRSQTVNKAVGGTRLSRHLRGLAIDIVPGDHMRLLDAADTIWSAAVADKLGMVQQVIYEPACVHVAWYAINEPDRGMGYLKQTPTGYVTIDGYVPINTDKA